MRPWAHSATEIHDCNGRGIENIQLESLKAAVRRYCYPPVRRSSHEDVQSVDARQNAPARRHF